MDEQTPAAPAAQPPARRESALTTRVDVQSLLDKAIEKGDVEVVERMLAMAERVKAETARDAFNEAVAEFQRRCPPIRKTETAEIPSRTGRGYTYSYAPLEGILRVVLPLMGELGLSHRWRGGISGQSVVINCRLSHVMGHFEESGDIPIPIDQGKAEGMGASAPQRIGIATTYGRRYTLLMVLGLNPEDDPDGAIDPDDAGGSTVKQPTRKAQAPVQTEAGAAFYAKLPQVPVGSTVELRGQVGKIAPVEGTTDGKAWKMFNIYTIGGDRVSTFDTKLMDAAEGFRQSGELVAMTCKLTPKGWSFSEIWAADQPPGE